MLIIHLGGEKFCNINNKTGGHTVTDVDLHKVLGAFFTSPVFLSVSLRTNTKTYPPHPQPLPPSLPPSRGPNPNNFGDPSKTDSVSYRCTLTSVCECVCVYCVCVCVRVRVCVCVACMRVFVACVCVACMRVCVWRLCV